MCSCFKGLHLDIHCCCYYYLHNYIYYYFKTTVNGKLSATIVYILNMHRVCKRTLNSNHSTSTDDDDATSKSTARPSQQQTDDLKIDIASIEAYHCQLAQYWQLFGRAGPFCCVVMHIGDYPFKTYRYIHTNSANFLSWNDFNFYFDV